MAARRPAATVSGDTSSVVILLIQLIISWVWKFNFTSNFYLFPTFLMKLQNYNEFLSAFIYFLSLLFSVWRFIKNKMDLEDYEEEVMVTMTENTTSSGSSPLPQNMTQEDIDFQQDLETLMTIGTMSTHIIITSLLSGYYHLIIVLSGYYHFIYIPHDSPNTAPPSSLNSISFWNGP